MGERYVFHYDPSRCIKCYACEISCSQWHGIPAGTFKLRRVSETVEGEFPDIKRIFHSETCRHCAEPACLGACPEGAIMKSEADGIMAVVSDKCTGCRMCLDACPFNIPQFDANGIMHLCDRCSDRLAEGKNPICSDACPTEALKWKKV